MSDLVDRQYVGDGKIDPSEEYNRGSVVTHETDQFFDESGTASAPSWNFIIPGVEVIGE